ncbi:MAG: hypothetical protein Q8P81_02180, partial [Nanoarchaeota archaeon]|nr:hypothetical protein [Nanoarchaeota archaeon]
MANQRQVVVVSDYSLGDETGPYRTIPINDILDLQNLTVSGTINLATGVSLSGAVSETTSELHIYADATGSDSNSGLSGDAPKATLSASFALVPKFCKHNVCVHLTGTFSEFGTTYFSPIIDSGVTVLIDGGTITQAVLGTTAGDIHAATGMGVTGAGWSDNMWTGFWLVITSGALSGERRVIQSNTTDTLVVTKNFSGDPGAVNFQILYPLTTLTSTTDNGFLVLANGSSTGTLQIQNVHVAGTKASIRVVDSVGLVNLTAITSLSTYLDAFYVKNSQNVQFTCDSVLNSSTFAVDTSIKTGVSLITYTSYTPQLYIESCNYVLLAGGYWNYVDAHSVLRLEVYKGNCIRQIQLYAVSQALFASEAGYAKVSMRNGPGTDGMICVRDGSNCVTGNLVDCSNGASQGIFVSNHGYVHIVGTGTVMTGTGNVEWGCYAYRHGVVLMVSGATPTLTGINGNVTVPGGGN